MTPLSAKSAARPCWLLSAALLAACQSGAPPPPVLEPLQQPTALQAAPPRISGAIPAERSKPIFEDRGGAAANGRRGAAATSLPAGVENGQGGDITLRFADTDIREVVRVILGTTLKLNYTIDPAVQGTATLDTGTPVSRAELLPTLEVLLNQNGATLVRRGNLYAIMPTGAAAISNAAAAGGADAIGAGSQVVTLRYASAKELAKVLEPYVGEGSKLAVDPNRNALVVSGDSGARQTLMTLIRTFDVDVLAGQSFLILPSGDADTAKVAASIEKALRAEAEGPLANLVRIVPLPRVNAVLVASSQPRYLDAAKRLYRLTSRAESSTARTWNVYYVQNGQSADLENLLQRAFTPRNVSPTPAPGGTAPGADTLTTGVGRGSETGGMGGRTGTTGTGGGAQGGLGSGLTSPAGAAATSGALSSALTGPVTSPATEALSSEPGPAGGAGGDTENRMRIIANRRNNALLIYATPSEYAVVERMLRKIDIIPMQVLINATIAEVTLNDTLQYGTQFFFKISRVSETLGAIPAFPPGPMAPTGLVGFAISKAPEFILRALSDVSTVKVLSAPQLLVMDNEPARLQVGQQVPILTGTATSTLTTGAPIVNSVDYRSTGVIMQVVPRINSGGLVTLDIAQEVSNVGTPAANTAQGSPTFDDRVVRTRVAVQNGQTIALAGLIRDSSQDDNNGVPFLKDVPLLGTLLSTQTSSRTRTELLVLITPQVVHDQRDARALTEDLRRQLINASMVPQELNRKPVKGSPNPHGL